MAVLRAYLRGLLSQMKVISERWRSCAIVSSKILRAAASTGRDDGRAPRFASKALAGEGGGSRSSVSDLIGAVGHACHAHATTASTSTEQAVRRAPRSSQPSAASWRQTNAEVFRRLVKGW